MAEMTMYQCDGCDKIIDGDGTHYMLQTGAVMIGLKPGTGRSQVPMPNGQMHFHNYACMRDWATTKATEAEKLLKEIAERLAQVHANREVPAEQK